MKKYYLFLCLVPFTASFAQKSFNDYAQFYPIGEDPNLRYMSSYSKQETILFEANPTVRYSVYNNFMRGLMEEYKHTQAWYISFRPLLRMYNEISFPVKTPSYRMFLGTQHLYRIRYDATSDKIQEFLGFSFESGHYSNGQAGCAFSDQYPDDCAACDSIYNTITPTSNLSDKLNRKNGNFSTNLSELVTNYRWYRLDKNNEPKEMHSFHGGYVLYHKLLLGLANFGGYSDEDIRIYGQSRILMGYEYMEVFKEGEGIRVSFKQNIEIIQGAHKFVNPIRMETIFTLYPFVNYKNFILRPTAIGIFMSYVYGHDNYNFRLVDSGHQITFGMSWTQFPPFAMKKNSSR
jgi:hypothetical protein